MILFADALYDDICRHGQWITKRRIRIACVSAWLLAFSNFITLSIITLFTRGETDPICNLSNYIPVRYLQFVFGPVVGVIFILLVLLHVRMIILLRRRADVLASMTSNKSSTSGAHDATDAMVYLSFFVTGK